MSTATAASQISREPALAGQTVVIIGGTSGMGLETGRLASAEGAKLILVARNPQHLDQAARELGAQQTAALDATDFTHLERFFDELTSPINHLFVTGPGPYYGPLAEFDFDKARRDIDTHLLLP